MTKETVRDHFDAIAGDYDRWKERSSYYYELLADAFREFVPLGATVLEIGCGTGTLLASLRPRRGVGVDISPKMVEIAAAKFPGLSFLISDAEALDLGKTFEYIIVPDVIEHLSDVGAMFRSVFRHCVPGTRVIVSSVNPLWAPVLHLAERLGLKMPEGEHRWLSARELMALAGGAGLAACEEHGRILLPKRIPLLAPLLNRLAAGFRGAKPLCLTQIMVFSPRQGTDPSFPPTRS
jgi:ubiquinone/menaquinone biosynthesis C-methylase UbiE